MAEPSALGCTAPLVECAECNKSAKNDSNLQEMLLYLSYMIVVVEQREVQGRILLVQLRRGYCSMLSLLLHSIWIT